MLDLNKVPNVLPIGIIVGLFIAPHDDLVRLLHRLRSPYSQHVDVAKRPAHWLCEPDKVDDVFHFMIFLATAS